MLLPRYFFPPTAEDLAARKQYDAGEITNTEPDDATDTEDEEQDGEEEGWEEVEKQEGTSEDGVEVPGAKGEVSTSSILEEQTEAGSKAEGVGTESEKDQTGLASEKDQTGLASEEDQTGLASEEDQTRAAPENKLGKDW